MAVVEVVLGALFVAAGGGAGWIGRGKYDAAQRANAAATKAAKSERRKAGGQKAAATRKAKAEKAAAELTGSNKDASVSVNGRVLDMGTVQRQQFQGGMVGQANGAAVDSSLYGRGEQS